jgi:hypothetical protein
MTGHTAAVIALCGIALIVAATGCGALLIALLYHRREMLEDVICYNSRIAREYNTNEDLRYQRELQKQAREATNRGKTEVKQYPEASTGAHI